MRIWIPTVAATGLLALAAAGPSVAAGPPAGADIASVEAAAEDHHGMDDQERIAGMGQMHELMTRDNPGMAQMHEQMMDADTGMDSKMMMPSSLTPDNGEMS